MRILFVGASETAVVAAEALIDDGHDVVVIEVDSKRIDELSERLDCSFLHGDGGRPAVLREAGGDEADVVLCLTDEDRANVLAGLVATHLGAKKVIVSVQDAELESVCQSLDLNTVIVPARTIGRHLQDLVRGVDTQELSSVLRFGARLFGFVIAANQAGTLKQLDLPKQTHPLWLYRGKETLVIESNTKLNDGDHLVVLTTIEQIKELTKLATGSS